MKRILTAVLAVCACGALAQERPGFIDGYEPRTLPSLNMTFDDVYSWLRRLNLKASNGAASAQSGIFDTLTVQRKFTSHGINHLYGTLSIGCQPSLYPLDVRGLSRFSGDTLVDVSTLTVRKGRIVVDGTTFLTPGTPRGSLIAITADPHHSIGGVTCVQIGSVGAPWTGYSATRGETGARSGAWTGYYSDCGATTYGVTENNLWDFYGERRSRFYSVDTSSLSISGYGNLRYGGASLDLNYTGGGTLLLRNNSAGVRFDGRVIGGWYSGDAGGGVQVGTATTAMLNLTATSTTLRGGTAFIGIDGGNIILSEQGNATNEAVRCDRNLTAGAGLTGGGNLTANRTFNMVASSTGGLIVHADSVAVNAGWGFNWTSTTTFSNANPIMFADNARWAAGVAGLTIPSTITWTAPQTFIPGITAGPSSFGIGTHIGGVALSTVAFAVSSACAGTAYPWFTMSNTDATNARVGMRIQSLGATRASMISDSDGNVQFSLTPKDGSSSYFSATSGNLVHQVYNGNIYFKTSGDYGATFPNTSTITPTAITWGQVSTTWPSSGTFQTSVQMSSNVVWTGGRVWYVPIYGSIASYITGASDGDTLILAAGTYTVTAMINPTKRLTIAGQGNNTTYIQGAASLNRVVTVSSGCVLRDLSINSAYNSGDFTIFAIATHSHPDQQVFVENVGVYCSSVSTYSVTGISYGGSPHIRFKNVDVVLSHKEFATGKELYGFTGSGSSSFDNRIEIIDCNVDLVANGNWAFGLHNYRSNTTTTTIVVVNSRVITHNLAAAQSRAVDFRSGGTSGAYYVGYGNYLQGQGNDISANNDNKIYSYGDILAGRKLSGTIAATGVVTSSGVYSNTSVGLWAGSANVQYDGTALWPSTTNDDNLGTNSLRWKNLYLAGNLIASSSATITKTGDALGLFGGGGANNVTLLMGRQGTAPDAVMGIAGTSGHYYAEAVGGDLVLRQANASGKIILGVQSNGPSMAISSGSVDFYKNVNVSSNVKTARLNVSSYLVVASSITTPVIGNGASNLTLPSDTSFSNYAYFMKGASTGGYIVGGDTDINIYGNEEVDIWASDTIWMSAKYLEIPSQTAPKAIIMTSGYGDGDNVDTDKLLHITEYANSTYTYLGISESTGIYTDAPFTAYSGIVSGGNINPIVDNVNYLGGVSKEWARVYTRRIYSDSFDRLLINPRSGVDLGTVGTVQRVYGSLIDLAGVTTIQSSSLTVQGAILSDDVVSADNFRALDYTTHSSGKGLEMQYDSSNNVGYLFPYNRDTPAYTEHRILGNPLRLYGNDTMMMDITGTSVTIKNTLEVQNSGTGGIRINAQSPSIYLVDSDGGETSGYLNYNNGVWVFADSTERLKLDSGALYPFSDNGIALGGSGNRWSTLYTTKIINKQDSNAYGNGILNYALNGTDYISILSTSTGNGYGIIQCGDETAVRDLYLEPAGGAVVIGDLLQTVGSVTVKGVGVLIQNANARLELADASKKVVLQMISGDMQIQNNHGDAFLHFENGAGGTNQQIGFSGVTSIDSGYGFQGPNDSNYKAKAYAWDTYTCEDAYKADKVAISSATDALSKLTGITYRYATAEEAAAKGKALNYDARMIGKPGIGITVQDLEVLERDHGITGLVSRDKDGNATGINLTNLVPVLVNAVREQDARIDALERDFADMRKAIDELKVSK